MSFQMQSDFNTSWVRIFWEWYQDIIFSCVSSDIALTEWFTLKPLCLKSENDSALLGLFKSTEFKSCLTEPQGMGMYLWTDREE